MTDPPRLLEQPSPGLASTLLAAGRDEAPPDAAVRRTLLAVGVGAAVLTSSSAAGGALISGAAGSAVAKGSAGSASLILAAKWVGIGAIGGLVTATAAYELVPSERAPSPSSVVEPAVVRTSAPKRPAPPSGIAVTPAEAPAEETEIAETTEPARRSGVSAAPRAEAASEDPAAPLAAEVAFVDRARTAFQAGDFVRTLTHLARYEEEFPGQRLHAEVLFLRMEAETGLGDTASAQAAARRILAGYPKSPHAARARGVLGAR